MGAAMAIAPSCSADPAQCAHGSYAPQRGACARVAPWHTLLVVPCWLNQRGARPRGRIPQPTGPQAGVDCSAPPLLVAKVENARVTVALAQLGQTIGAPFASPRISFSKRSPQVWQIYSYSGIGARTSFMLCGWCVPRPPALAPAPGVVARPHPGPAPPGRPAEPARTGPRDRSRRW